MQSALRSRSSRSLLLTALASLALAPVASAGWRLTSIRDLRDPGVSSFRFDPAGRPAVAFGRGSVFYAVWTGAAWEVETVAPGCGGERNPSLAFDASGWPAIAYHDQAHDLRLARFNGATWTITTVDATVGVDYQTSLAFDALGNPGIAYYDYGNHDLRYAGFDGTSWQRTLVDGAGVFNDVGLFAALAFDPAGRPAISYQGDWNVKFARFDGSVWQVNILDNSFTTGAYTSIAFDPAGNAAVSYFEGWDFGHLRLAHHNGTFFDIEDVAWCPSFAGTSLGFDRAGNPAIAYHHYDLGSRTDGKLHYAVKTGTTWSIQTVDSGLNSSPTVRLAAYPSLAFDAAGNPGISYIDNASFTLKLARWTGTSFALDPVVGADRFNNSQASIAFDPVGRPAVSFADGPTGGLQLGRFDGTTWSVESVDPGMWTGFGSSLVFDAAGNPLIAYDDVDSGLLKLARWNGGSWALETVDGPLSNPMLPMTPSLALDAAGNPAISYAWRNGGGYAQKFARWHGPGWSIEVVDPAIPSSLSNSRSLVFDPAGYPAIAHLHGAGPVNLEVQLTSFDGATWNSETLASRGNVNGWGPPSLVFDGAGNPAVCYTDSPDIVLAHRVGGTWQTEFVVQGIGGEIATDGAGDLAIPFRDFSGAGNVRMARWDGAAWSFETILPGTDWPRVGEAAIAATGAIATVYRSGDNCRTPEVALLGVDAAVYRGAVLSLDPGWQAAALPLTSLNDDPTWPFPRAVVLPGRAADAAPPAVPLVLYRVLRSGNLTAGNTLRATKVTTGSGVALSF